MNLFLALAAEHFSRTGHDIHTQSPLDPIHMICNVCLHLWAERRTLEKEEAEFYQNEELRGEDGPSK